MAVIEGICFIKSKPHAIKINTSEQVRSEEFPDFHSLALYEVCEQLTFNQRDKVGRTVVINKVIGKIMKAVGNEPLYGALAVYKSVSGQYSARCCNESKDGCNACPFYGDKGYKALL